MKKWKDSKLKSDILHQFYKNNYLCEKGHSIIWIGPRNKSYESCDKCGEYNSSTQPIRWSCKKCQLFFCAICYKTKVDKCCPNKHKLKFSKSNKVDFFSSYTCDYCFGHFATIDGVLYDKDCDYTICPNCYYDSCDIPEILED